MKRKFDGKNVDDEFEKRTKTRLEIDELTELHNIVGVDETQEENFFKILDLCGNNMVVLDCAKYFHNNFVERLDDDQVFEHAKKFRTHHNYPTNAFYLKNYIQDTFAGTAEDYRLNKRRIEQDTYNTMDNIVLNIKDKEIPDEIMLYVLEFLRPSGYSYYEFLDVYGRVSEKMYLLTLIIIGRFKKFTLTKYNIHKIPYVVFKEMKFADVRMDVDFDMSYFCRHFAISGTDLCISNNTHMFFNAIDDNMTLNCKKLVICSNPTWPGPAYHTLTRKTFPNVTSIKVVIKGHGIPVFNGGNDSLFHTKLSKLSLINPSNSVYPKFHNAILCEVHKFHINHIPENINSYMCMMPNVLTTCVILRIKHDIHTTASNDIIREYIGSFRNLQRLFIEVCGGYNFYKSNALSYLEATNAEIELKIDFYDRINPFFGHNQFTVIPVADILPVQRVNFQRIAFNFSCTTFSINPRFFFLITDEDIESYGMEVAINNAKEFVLTKKIVV